MEKQNCLLYAGVCLIKGLSEDLSFFLESLLSVRFITKLISKADLAVCLTYFFMLHYTKVHVYTMPQGHIIDSFVDLSINWPVNILLIGNLTFC